VIEVSGAPTDEEIAAIVAALRTCHAELGRLPHLLCSGDTSASMRVVEAQTYDELRLLARGAKHVF
jgi:hypothetical protein